MTEGGVPRNDKEVVPLRPFLLSLRAEGVAISVGRGIAQPRLRVFLRVL